MGETSIEMNDLVLAALDHGIASVEEEGPFISFVMTVNLQGEKTLTRFAQELLEEGLEAARSISRVYNV